MIDIIIIGGGYAGTALASSCVAEGLETTIIEMCCTKPESWNGGWIHGRGVVSAPGMVAILDADTADERRIIQGKAIVFAIGALRDAEMGARMLGIAKLGVEVAPDSHNIVVDTAGRTRAKGVFATGGCASNSTPYIIGALKEYCRTYPTEIEAHIGS